MLSPNPFPKKGLESLKLNPQITPRNWWTNFIPTNQMELSFFPKTVEVETCSCRVTLFFRLSVSFHFIFAFLLTWHRDIVELSCLGFFQIKWLNGFNCTFCYTLWKYLHKLSNLLSIAFLHTQSDWILYFLRNILWFAQCICALFAYLGLRFCCIFFILNVKLVCIFP